jgi:hypothetical protein
MNPKRWSSVILSMGLAVALIPLSAHAWPNRPQARTSNHQAFTRSQPRGHAFGKQAQGRQWQSPRGNAFGRYGQRVQWRQPRGNAFGRQGQGRQWQPPRGHSYGYYGQRAQWRQPQGRAFGWQAQGRQWQPPRNSYSQPYRQGSRQFQQPTWGQHQNSQVPYARIGYPGQSQAPNFTSRSNTYNPDPTVQTGQSSPQSGFHRRGAYGNSPNNSKTQTPTTSTTVSSD